MTNLRIGHGYDVHRLVEGRKLILGGVDIPWEKGLLGHSDADVLVHAVMDALTGAADRALTAYGLNPRGPAGGYREAVSRHRPGLCRYLQSEAAVGGRAAAGGEGLCRGEYRCHAAGPGAQGRAV